MDNPKFWQGQLFINEFSIDFCFDTINLNILRLFPLNSISSKQITLNQFHQLSGEIYESEEYHECIVFEISVKNMIDRLHTFGYTIDKAKEEYETAKHELLNTQFHKSKEERIKIDENYPHQGAFETQEKGYNYISKLNSEEFLNGCNNIIKEHKRRNIKEFDNRRKSIIPEDLKSQIERYLVCNGFGVFQFKDINHYLRILIEKCSYDSKIQYAFINSYEGMLESVKKYYLSNFEYKSLAFKLGLPTIIITEGQTDSKYLKFGFELFYPHLMDLFFFWDFSIKLGSADALVSTTQSLISSKIPNNIISIFDNDTEGNRAKCKLVLSLDTTPENVKIITYPELEFAKAYPVINLQQIKKHDDVNSRGCAIEMYLGQDILKDTNGEFYPLYDNDNQLKFKNSTKKVIQNKFEDKMTQSNSPDDFLDLKLIIDHILKSIYS